MKVLWISNVIFPEACQVLSIPCPVVGGWMHAGAINFLSCNQSVELTVASLYNGKELLYIDQYKIKYYLIPSPGQNQKYNSKLENYFLKIRQELNPDIIHVHGTEYPHSLACVNALGNKNFAVSIQGLVSVYSQFYLGGLSTTKALLLTTIRDILRFDSLISQQKRMRKRGIYEHELLRNVKHIIGRTSWDRSNSQAINPSATYHYCNETLRDSFYESGWAHENCIPHSIFLSQAHYPIKGLHQILKALPLVLQEFPNTKLYVAGSNFMNKSFVKRSGFARYISGLIEENHLENKIEFLGSLNESEITKWYLNANVFVCPSSIENSPNSVGEAQLIGTPCIASYVGGNMDMIDNEQTGFLYRFEETPILALRICQVFADRNLAEKLSKQARKKASERHDKITNAKRLYTIYEDILNEAVPGL